MQSQKCLLPVVRLQIRFGCKYGCKCDCKVDSHLQSHSKCNGKQLQSRQQMKRTGKQLFYFILLFLVKHNKLTSNIKIRIPHNQSGYYKLNLK